jgi:hypothetical protein
MGLCRCVRDVVAAILLGNAPTACAKCSTWQLSNCRYDLVNPLPGQQHTILYVGLTTNLKTRYINWLNGKEPWFRDFVTKGYIPHCSTLHIVKDRDPEKELARARAREVYWIE